jgi:hypothetical protein
MRRLIQLNRIAALPDTECYGGRRTLSAHFH